MFGHLCATTALLAFYGFAFSLVGGALVVAPVVWVFHCLGNVPKKQGWREHAFTVLFGMGERAAITAIAMYKLEAAGAFALAWMGLKLACYWNRPGLSGAVSDPSNNPEFRRVARGGLSALIGSLVSAFFGIAGAYIICR